jgi:hypothetical protein
MVILVDAANCRAAFSGFHFCNGILPGADGDRRPDVDWEGQPLGFRDAGDFDAYLAAYVPYSKPAPPLRAWTDDPADLLRNDPERVERRPWQTPQRVAAALVVVGSAMLFGLALAPRRLRRG